MQRIAVELQLDPLDVIRTYGSIRGLLREAKLPDAAKRTALRIYQRLAEAGAVTSVGSRGDSYDNALAESVIGLYKTELIRKRGPWRSFEQLELATARWVEWYNQRRLHSSIADVPPAEFEATYYRERAVSAVA